MYGKVTWEDWETLTSDDGHSVLRRLPIYANKDLNEGRTVRVITGYIVETTLWFGGRHTNISITYVPVPGWVVDKNH